MTDPHEGDVYRHPSAGEEALGNLVEERWEKMQ